MPNPQTKIDEIQEKFKSVFRGSLLGTTTSKLLSFIQIADTRANAIIILNSIIIPIALNKIDQPTYTVPVVLAILTAILSIYAAIVSLYPKRLRKKELDLLHFSDIAQLSEAEYLRNMRGVFNDYEKLSEAFVRNIYRLSAHIVQPKFKWVKISYTIFVVGYLLVLLTIVGQLWWAA